MGRSGRSLVLKNKVSSRLQVTGSLANITFEKLKVVGASSEIYRLSGSECVFKRFLKTSRGEEVLRDREIDKDHLKKAELVADQALDIIGGPYKNVLARVKDFTHNHLGDGLLIEYVQGETMVEKNKQNRKSKLSIKEQDNTKINLFYDHSVQISKEEYLLRARKIVFLDTVMANSDRHFGNMFFTKNGPVGIDQGLCFTPTTAYWQARHRPMQPDFYSDVLIHNTGGTTLLKEERIALLKLLKSSWLDRVKESFGEQIMTETKERIEHMLKNNQLHPYIIGTDIVEDNKKWLFKHRYFLNEN
jgi:hypothetical protein